MDKNTLIMMGKIAVADGLLSYDEEKIIREYAISINVNPDAFIAQLKREAALRDTKVLEIASNSVKGIEFENHILRIISKIEGMKVISRSADFKLGKPDILDERSLGPDFQISQTIGRFKVEYWLECKYRSTADTLTISSKQLLRYRQVKKESSHPVFFVYGEGGIPKKPAKLYFFDINDIISEKVSKLTLKGYTIVNSKLVKGYEITLSEIGEILKNVMLSDCEKCIE